MTDTSTPSPLRGKHQPAGLPRGATLVAAAATVTTAAFAGGGLLTQTVVVPLWQVMDPSEFLTRFRTSGPATGATLFPIEIAAMVLLTVTAYPAIRNRQPSGLFWVSAAACIAGTILLLPIYFIDANLTLLDPAFPPQNVPGQLTSWYAWNWLRTGLAIAATTLACAALVTSGRDPRGLVS